MNAEELKKYKTSKKLRAKIELSAKKYKNVPLQNYINSLIQEPCDLPEIENRINNYGEFIKSSTLDEELDESIRAYLLKEYKHQLKRNNLIEDDDEEEEEEHPPHLEDQSLMTRILNVIYQPARFVITFLSAGYYLAQGLSGILEITELTTLTASLSIGLFALGGLCVLFLYVSFYKPEVMENINKFFGRKEEKKIEEKLDLYLNEIQDIEAIIQTINKEYAHLKHWNLEKIEEYKRKIAVLQVNLFRLKENMNQLDESNSISLLKRIFRWSFISILSFLTGAPIGAGFGFVLGLAFVPFFGPVAIFVASISAAVCYGFLEFPSVSKIWYKIWFTKDLDKIKTVNQEQAKASEEAKKILDNLETDAKNMSEDHEKIEKYNKRESFFIKHPELLGMSNCLLKKEDKNSINHYYECNFSWHSKIPDQQYLQKLTRSEYIRTPHSLLYYNKLTHHVHEIKRTAPELLKLDQEFKNDHETKPLSLEQLKTIKSMTGHTHPSINQAMLISEGTHFFYANPFNNSIEEIKFQGEAIEDKKMNLKLLFNAMKKNDSRTATDKELGVIALLLTDREQTKLLKSNAWNWVQKKQAEATKISEHNLKEHLTLEKKTILFLENYIEQLKKENGLEVKKPSSKQENTLINGLKTLFISLAGLIAVGASACYTIAESLSGVIELTGFTGFQGLVTATGSLAWGQIIPIALLGFAGVSCLFMFVSFFLPEVLENWRSLFNIAHQEKPTQLIDAYLIEIEKINEISTLLNTTTHVSIEVMDERKQEINNLQNYLEYLEEHVDYLQKKSQTTPVKAKSNLLSFITGGALSAALAITVGAVFSLGTMFTVAIILCSLCYYTFVEHTSVKNMWARRIDHVDYNKVDEAETLINQTKDQLNTDYKLTDRKTSRVKKVTEVAKQDLKIQEYFSEHSAQKRNSTPFEAKKPKFMLDDYFLPQSLEKKNSAVDSTDSIEPRYKK